MSGKILALHSLLLLFPLALAVWAFIEITFYGGDRNDKDHNRPPWNLW